MKKNAIGHMHPEKKSFFSFFKRIHFLPLLLCLVLAVILWLLVVNIRGTDAGETAAVVTNLALLNSLFHAF